MKQSISVERALRALGVVAALAAGGSAHAALIEFSYGTPVSAGSMAGSGPWLDVKIEDVSAGVVKITVSSFLTGQQTLTGLWFNIPTVATIASLTSLDFDAVSGTIGLPAPSPFVSPIFTAPAGNQSGVTATPSLNPSGATPAQVGSYDLLIRFPNSAPGFQGVGTEMFNLVSNATSGLSAASFQSSAPRNAGGPSFYSVASFTNALGTAGSGNAFVTAAVVSPVPLPGAFLLMLSGLGALGVLPRLRRARA